MQKIIYFVILIFLGTLFACNSQDNISKDTKSVVQTTNTNDNELSQNSVNNNLDRSDKQDLIVQNVDVEEKVEKKKDIIKTAKVPNKTVKTNVITVEVISCTLENNTDENSTNKKYCYSENEVLVLKLKIKNDSSKSLSMYDLFQGSMEFFINGTELHYPSNQRLYNDNEYQNIDFDSKIRSNSESIIYYVIPTNSKKSHKIDIDLFNLTKNQYGSYLKEVKAGSISIDNI